MKRRMKRNLVKLERSICNETLIIFPPNWQRNARFSFTRKFNCRKEKKVIFVTKEYYMLALYALSYIFHQFFRYSLRLAPIVYRLIDAALIGNFFYAPFLF